MAIITPAVFANAVNSKLGVKLRAARLSFDATDIVGDITSYGNTVHFPKLNRISDAVTVVKGTALVPSIIDMNDSFATIQHVAAPVRVYDIDIAQVKGILYDKIVVQVADTMAKKLDSDLINEMNSNVSYKVATAGATAITAAEIFSGLARFGDDIDTDSFAGILINSRLVSSFYAMDEFTNIDRTYANSGNGFCAEGTIGKFMGIDVVVSDHQTFDATAGVNECKTFIVKKDALGYILQRDITIREDYNIMLLATDIVASALYAVKLLDTSGACLLRKTIA